MKNTIVIGLVAILGYGSLPAVPPASDQAVERIIHAVMPLSKQKELFNNAADRMAAQCAQKGLPPAGVAELRTALRNFMATMVDDGTLTKLTAAQFREHLTDGELLTLADFLESSVGQKLMNRTITLTVDKERLNRDMKTILDARTTELTGVMVRIFQKYGIAAN